ncbi:MAG: family NAD(P)-dependent oxidoreductase [Bradyrhizobium sp.]|nr:family NAD(P)-dependent oxidoreductase [Bradyrhizobium sp.]
MLELNDGVAVVTGAGSGLGRELAKACAGHGMRLVLADIEVAGLRETAALLPPDIECMTACCDVSDALAVSRLADETYERFGRVDILFNNAGILSTGVLWESSPAEWLRVMSVNVFGVANGIASFVPRMLQSGRAGHIVNTASLAGLVSTPGFGVYTASKHAVVALTECLYHELVDAESAIGVSLLCPAWVSTGLADREALPSTRGQKNDNHGGVALELARAAMGASRLTAADIAAMALSAVKENRFYVVTHKKSLASVQLRMEDILLERSPTAIQR